MPRMLLLIAYVLLVASSTGLSAQTNDDVIGRWCARDSNRRVNVWSDYVLIWRAGDPASDDTFRCNAPLRRQDVGRFAYNGPCGFFEGTVDATVHLSLHPNRNQLLAWYVRGDRRESVSLTRCPGSQEPPRR